MSDLGKNTSQNMSPDDYMRLAIAMVQHVPQYPFGVVIVRQTTGEVLAHGFNRSSLNPTFHGEIDETDRCATDYSPFDWTKLYLHTTAEPFPRVPESDRVGQNCDDVLWEVDSVSSTTQWAANRYPSRRSLSPHSLLAHHPHSWHSRIQVQYVVEPAHNSVFKQ